MNIQRDVNVNPAALKFRRVSDELGQKNLNRMQASSLDIYDSLAYELNQTEYIFYREASTRAFPFTNLTQSGNKLNVGEGMTVQAIYFNVLEKIVDEGISEIYEPDGLDTASPLGSVALGEFDVIVGNQTILKNLRLLTSGSFYNKFAKTQQQVYILDNPFFVPPLVTFEIRLRVPRFTPILDPQTTYFLQATMSGFAGILSLKKTL